MELLSPAGNVQKLYYAFAYGADAAYIGLKNFSLRVKADNFKDDEYKKVCELKKQFAGKRLHCALNIMFHDSELAALRENIDYFKLYPIDAFIVQDLGVVPLLQKEFPNAQLHLSTQASCVNGEAVKMYRNLGFSRIVLGREISLDEIKAIKDAVPDMELEAFAHGAMCIAYAGRCLLSSYLTGRSAQEGSCSHTCRWNFNMKSSAAGVAEAKALAESGTLLLEEQQRPGEYFPVYEGDNFTAIMSSKDLRMIEHLADLKNAGVDSIKIEGRMKSIYYVALVTQAYRKALDAIDGKITQAEAAPFIAELDNVAHRESTTGFYYSRKDADETTSGASDSKYILAGTVDAKIDGEEAEKIFAAGDKTMTDREGAFQKLSPQAQEARRKEIAAHPEKTPRPLEKREGWHLYKFTPLNKIDENSPIEFVVPGKGSVVAEKGSFVFANQKDGTLLKWSCDGNDVVLYAQITLAPATIVRLLDEGFVAGSIRDKGR